MRAWWVHASQPPPLMPSEAQQRPSLSPMGHLAVAKSVARMVWIDAGQIVRHGRDAPRWAERIWVDPSACSLVATDVDRGRRRSGQVVGGTWGVAPVETVAKVRMAEEHWRTGASWKQVGAYDYVMENLARLSQRDGYRTTDDVERRFEYLDAVFDTVRREGRLRPRSERPGRTLRENGGVYMHVGGDREPVFGNGGCHRLAMARVLGLARIPAQLGAVHPDALSAWRTLRSGP